MTDKSVIVIISKKLMKKITSDQFMYFSKLKGE